MLYTPNTIRIHLYLLPSITHIEFLIGPVILKVLLHFEQPGTVSAKDFLSQKILNTLKNITVIELLIASHSVSSIFFMPLKIILNVLHPIKQFAHRIKRVEKGRNTLIMDYRSDKLSNLWYRSVRCNKLTSYLKVSWGLEGGQRIPIMQTFCHKLEIVQECLIYCRILKDWHKLINVRGWQSSIKVNIFGVSIIIDFWNFVLWKSWKDILVKIEWTRCCW